MMLWNKQKYILATPTSQTPFTHPIAKDTDSDM